MKNLVSNKCQTAVRRFCRSLRVALYLSIAWAFAWLALSGPAMAQSTDPDLTKVDNDNDGLIEIYTLSDLDNIRHNLAGTSLKTAADATEMTSGCPTEDDPHEGPDGVEGNDDDIKACYGYELMNDLDFDSDNDGHNDGEPYWNGGAGWDPIGEDGASFTATFDGRGYTIANLFIDRDSESDIGLFGVLGGSGEIRNLGVVDAEVSGNERVGGLAGENAGTITASYTLATVSGNNIAGGLVGTSGVGGTIAASYAVATVSGNNIAGGLVGVSGGIITASYVVVAVSGSGSNVGGLVGFIFNADITESYFNTDLTAQTHADQGKTTDELREEAANTGIYSTWSNERWNFGTEMQYPGLKLPQLPDDSCPAAPVNIDVTKQGNNCIHRPLSSAPAFVAEFKLNQADDRGSSDTDGITNKSSVGLSGRIMAGSAPAMSTSIRIVSLATGALPDIMTNAMGDFTQSVALEEGSNRFALEIQQSGIYRRLPDRLRITLATQFDEALIKANYLRPLTDTDTPAGEQIVLGGMALNTNALSRIGISSNAEYAARDFVYLTTTTFSIQYASVNTNMVSTQRESLSLVHADDASQRVLCYDNGEVVLGADSVAFDAVPSCDLTGLPDGDYVMEVRVTGEDLAGNDGTVVARPSEIQLSLDTVAPTVFVTRTGDRIMARASDPFPSPSPTRVDGREDTLYSFQYQTLNTALAETCEAGFSGGVLTELDDYANQALPLSALDNEVYCFVATDRAGNQAVSSSADAVVTALQLRLRVFLESALP